jgi:anti-anti-sigma factor
MTTGRLLRLRDPSVRILVEIQPPTLCVSIDGELDLSCDKLLEAVTQIDLAGVTDVVIDLNDLSFCDVAGFDAVTRLHDSQREAHRRVHLLGAQRGFRRLADLVGRPDLLAAG